METNRLSDQERMTFVELYTDITKIVINDMIIEPGFARVQIDRIDSLLKSSAFSKEEKVKYTELVELLRRFV